MEPVAFFGMRGTGDFTVTGQRPENWREMILRMYPNGSAPLTAMLAMLKSEKTDDPRYHWFEQELPDQHGSVTGVYTNADLAGGHAYAVACAAGDTLYIKMSAADAAKFNPSHQVLLRGSTDLKADINVKVTAVTLNGASSYLTATALEIDDNGTTLVAAGCDTALVIGSIFSEGAGAPSSLMYDPNERNNQCQIFRTALDQTRTAMRTRLRTGDQVKEAKRQALEMHSIEMERSYILGIASTRTGSNGKPERTTSGIRSYLAFNRANHSTDSAAKWAQDGEDWLEANMEKLFRYGNADKICYCGSGALLGIQKLAKAGATIFLNPGAAAYGIKVITWTTPFGQLHLKTHPLFTLEPTLRFSMMVLDPPHLVYRYVDDTKYLPNRQAPDIDGEKSEYLTEAGLEVHFEKAHAWWDGVGLDGGQNVPNAASDLDTADLVTTTAALSNEF